MSVQAQGDALRSWLRAPAVALQLLTRIPVRLARVDDADLRRSVAFFPAVGVVVAAVGLLVRWALEAPLGRPAATVVAVGAMVVVTGAFHEDGLADSADGLWGGSTPERRIEIMRDSRIGAYGATALVLSLLFRVALLAPLPLEVFAAAVAAGHVLGRAAGVLLSALLPPVGEGGLGAKVIGAPGQVVGTAVAVQGVAVAVVAAGAWFWLPLLVAVLSVALVRRLAQRKLGGLTGDLLGGVNQVAHLAVMAAVVAVSGTSTA